MLDVHVLVHPDTSNHWVRECLDSVHNATTNAGYRVDVHVVRVTTPGHIGRERHAAYALGEQPYVTYVDDDDYVLPHAFSQMRSAMLDDYAVICTPEMHWQNGHLTRGNTRHHLIAYRRDVLIDHRPWVVCGDLAQMTHAIAVGNVIDLDDPAYVHRLYQSRGRALRRQSLDELRRARGQLTQ